jgi:hypothetical protein
MVVQQECVGQYTVFTYELSVKYKRIQGKIKEKYSENKFESNESKHRKCTSSKRRNSSNKQ